MSGDLSAGFLSDILAHPEDDTPRLIYADWLEDQGQEARAEFIRVQIELARLDHWDARYVPLKLREWELLRTHKRAWLKELPSLKSCSWSEFRRGFMTGCHLHSLKKWQKIASACREAVPVEEIAVQWPHSAQEFQVLATLPRLRSLRFWGHFPNMRIIEELADSPVLSSLRSLHLTATSLTEEAFRTLISSPHLRGLKELHVGGNHLGNRGIAALTESGTPEALETLSLFETAGYGGYGEDLVIDEEGLRWLADWPGLDSVRKLDLSGNSLNRAGLRTLLGSRHCAGLKDLSLQLSLKSAQTVEAFGEATSALRLTTLHLGENVYLGPSGLRKLVQAESLSELKVLTLYECDLNQSAMTALAKGKFLAGLLRLNLSRNYNYLEGLSALLDAGPRSLQALQLMDNGLNDDGVEALARCPALDALQVLDLSFNDLGQGTAEALKDPPHLRSLRMLFLGMSGLDRKAKGSLTRSPLRKRLALLSYGDVVPL